MSNWRLGKKLAMLLAVLPTSVERLRAGQLVAKQVDMTRMLHFCRYLISCSLPCRYLYSHLLPGSECVFSTAAAIEDVWVVFDLYGHTLQTPYPQFTGFPTRSYHFFDGWIVNSPLRLYIDVQVARKVQKGECSWCRFTLFESCLP